jgi:Ni/Fe-hydrogenase subunit HybB-like protein
VWHLFSLSYLYGYLKNTFGENQYHDLAKLLKGFTTFFAYIWFCQYLLIWYANIAEEAEYYVLREHYGWDWLFWLSIIINWVIPFVLLMPRQVKRETFVLWRVALLVLVGQWLNIFILVAPKVYEHLGVYNPQIGWPEVGLALGYVGFFGLVFFNELKKASLVPLQDTYLLEGLSLEQ